MTFDEYLKSPIQKNTWKKEYLGRTVYIKDKVVKVDIFQLPKMFTSDKNHAIELSKPFEVETYTRVHFESNNTWGYFLEGDKSNEFIPGKTVTFYDTVKVYNTSDGKRGFMESTYVKSLVNDYFSLIYTQRFNPIGYTSEWLDNTTYRITINKILDFPPIPINWIDVSVYNRDAQGKILDDFDYIKIYDEQNNLLTTFKTDGNKLNLDKEIAKGQIIEIEFDSEPKDINIVFYEDYFEFGKRVFLSLRF